MNARQSVLSAAAAAAAGVRATAKKTSAASASVGLSALSVSAERFKRSLGVCSAGHIMWRNGARKPGPTVVGARPSNNESDAARACRGIRRGACFVSFGRRARFRDRISWSQHRLLCSLEGARAACLSIPPPSQPKCGSRPSGNSPKMTDVTLTSLRSAPLFFREDATLQLYCLTPPCLPSKLPPLESKGFGRGRRPKGV